MHLFSEPDKRLPLKQVFKDSYPVDNYYHLKFAVTWITLHSHATIFLWFFSTQIS